MITEKQKESAKALAELATVIYMSALIQSNGDVDIAEAITTIMLPDTHAIVMDIGLLGACMSGECPDE